MKIRCVVIDDEPLARDYIAEFIKRVPYFSLVGLYENPLDAIVPLKSRDVDLVFSDIQMPELTGIDFLRSLNSPPLFVFITGNPKYAAESYELEVLDYLVKPYSFERFLKTANKAYEKHVSQPGYNLFDHYLPVKERSTTILLDFDKIIYLKADQDYVEIHSESKTYLRLESLKRVTALLPPNIFMQVQRSFVVNLKYVEEVNSTSIKLRKVPKPIPVGLYYKDELFRFLKIQ